MKIDSERDEQSGRASVEGIRLRVWVLEESQLHDHHCTPCWESMLLQCML